MGRETVVAAVHLGDGERDMLAGLYLQTLGLPVARGREQCGAAGSCSLYGLLAIPRASGHAPERPSSGGYPRNKKLVTGRVPSIPTSLVIFSRRSAVTLPIR